LLPLFHAHLPTLTLALCTRALSTAQMAAREPGGSAGAPAPRGAEGYMRAGKLLALDVLAATLANPAHDWAALRPELAAQLRGPLALALLRSCGAAPPAGAAAARLLVAVLGAAPLRAGLKAEVGVLYPLLLLRPLEGGLGAGGGSGAGGSGGGSGAESGGAGAALAALEGLAAVVASPQALVDVFVNYDCSLQVGGRFPVGRRWGGCTGFGF
jgi:hypothetical protein